MYEKKCSAATPAVAATAAVTPAAAAAAATAGQSECQDNDVKHKTSE